MGEALARAPSGFALIALASIASVVACGRPETVADRHAEEMREAVAKIEAERDRRDAPLGALEKTQPDESYRREGAAKGATPRVVQLGGPDDPGDADPNEPTARPEIKVVGPGGGRPPKGATGRGEARIGYSDEAATEAPPPEAPAAAPSPAASPPAAPPPATTADDPKKAYEDGLALVQAKSYREGIAALTAFLGKWPENPYAENATYWRGEAYYAQGEYGRARKDFEAVVAKYPGGSKAPGAMLKIGMCHDRTGSPSLARDTWARLRREYPRSEAVRKIPKETR